MSEENLPQPVDTPPAPSVPESSGVDLARVALRAEIGRAHV